MNTFAHIVRIFGLVVGFFGHVVGAQTPTPTPLPLTTPLAVGNYEFENLIYPDMYLNINYTYNNQSDVNATSGYNIYTGHYVAFRAMGDVLVTVHNGTGQTCTGGSVSTIALCTAGVCNNILKPYTARKTYVIPYVDDDTELRINYVTGQCSMLDSLVILPPASVADAMATQIYIYVPITPEAPHVITHEIGDDVFLEDRTLTSGDKAIIAVLGVIGAFCAVGVGVQLWKH